MTDLIQWTTASTKVTKNWSCHDCAEFCRCIKKNCLVEVFVPTFQHEKTISSAIVSVGEQIFQMGELFLFVHDDASSDRTGEQALAALSQVDFPFTFVQQLQNQFTKNGFSFFFESVKNSQAEFMAFLDGDDTWIEKTKLKMQVEALIRDPAATISHTTYFVSEAKGRHLQPDPSISRKELEDRAFLRRENFIGTLTCVLRVSAVKQGLPLLDLANSPVGDYPIWLVGTSSLESRIIYHDIPTANYNIHSENYWAKGSARAKLRKTRQLQKQLSKIFGEDLGEPVLVFCLRVVIRRLLSRMRGLISPGPARQAS